MFNLIKSILVVLVSYFILIGFGKYDFFGALNDIAVHLYVISSVIILLSLSCLFYFYKLKNSNKNLCFVFTLLLAMSFSSISVAETNSSSDEKVYNCPECTLNPGADDAEGRADSCWPCDVFEDIFDVFNSIVEGTVTSLTSGLLSLVVAGYGVWLVYTIMLQFFTFKDKDMGRFLTRIGTMSFKVLLISIILGYNSEIYNLILNPLISLIVEYAGGISGLDVQTSTGGSSPLSGAIKTNLLKIIDALFDEVAGGMKQGSVIICLASEAETKSGFIGSLLKMAFDISVPDMSLLYIGCVLWLCFALILIVFPFMVFDVLFRFGFFAIALPFVVAFWPFSFLHGIMYRLFKIFIVATLNFLLMLILFKIATSLVATIFKDDGIVKVANACMSGEYETVNKLIQTSADAAVFLPSFMIMFVTMAVLYMLKVIPGISGLLVGIGGFEAGAASALDNVSYSAAGGVANLGIASVGLAVDQVVQYDDKIIKENERLDKIGWGQFKKPSLSDRASKIGKFAGSNTQKAAGIVAGGSRKLISGVGTGVEKGTDAAGTAIMNGGKAMFAIPVIGPVAGAVVIGVGMTVQAAGKVVSVSLKTSAYLVEQAIKGTGYLVRKATGVVIGVGRGAALGSREKYKKVTDFESKDWS